MKIAHINSKAAAGGPVRGATFVRRMLACALIGGAAISVAHAGPGRGQPQYQQQQQQQEYRQDYSREADQRQRQYDERERAMQARAEEQRRQMEQQGNDGRRNSRMTPDERRDLRRQINEAGAELYPNQRGRR